MTFRTGGLGDAGTGSVDIWAGFGEMKGYINEYQASWEVEEAKVYFFEVLLLLTFDFSLE